MTPYKMIENVWIEYRDVLSEEVMGKGESTTKTAKVLEDFYELIVYLHDEIKRKDKIIDRLLKESES